MTRLELVKRLCREAGIGSSPLTTIGQSGENLRSVEWIDAAYEEIQNLHWNWDFLRTDFSVSASIAVPAPVSPTDLGTWKVDSFRCYLTATGTDDEQPMIYLPWDVFRDTCLLGTGRTQTGRPYMFSVKPDGDLSISPPIPDDTYTIVGEYFKEAQTLSADTSEPLFSQNQMAIVWKALIYYAAYSSEPDKAVMGESQYKKLIRKLELSQLPGYGWGPSLV